MESPHNADPSYREASSGGPDNHQHDRRCHPEEQRDFRGEVGDDARLHQLSFRGHLSFEESDRGAQGVVWPSTKRSPDLSKYHSWARGDHSEVGCLGYRPGEVDLPLSRSFVVARSTLRVGRGGEDRGGGS